MRDWHEPNDRAKSLGRMRGWAPGDYICRCVGCDRDHVADKRSVRCFECAATEEIEALRRLDAGAATHVETVLCMRTKFTGEPPYVGWEGLGLALTEALDERDRLREQVKANEPPVS